MFNSIKIIILSKLQPIVWALNEYFACELAKAVRTANQQKIS